MDFTSCRYLPGRVRRPRRGSDQYAVLGGFISNAHYWRKGIPWIQIEINRELYESGTFNARQSSVTEERIPDLRRRIWRILARFWEDLPVTVPPEEDR